MNLNSLLNDQESNDHDFYFCQSDNSNLENICHNNNVLLTKDVQYSAIELMPVQYSTMDLMPVQNSTISLMPFQCTTKDFQYFTTDLMLFQNSHQFYFNHHSNLNSVNFLKNNQVDYSMKYINEVD
ncbi:16061_t:CDS:1 [Gigaspora margarita]|uniref:16061_t:CDS:1 n=1 Tax=Gigaspora margarita TaxID=4874 RepID=A0ABM8VZE0_GIGMA|nr:16061_t:CDS:1 [Gigaspora margarita]